MRRWPECYCYLVGIDDYAGTRVSPAWFQKRKQRVMLVVVSRPGFIEITFRALRGRIETSLVVSSFAIGYSDYGAKRSTR